MLMLYQKAHNKSIQHKPKCPWDMGTNTSRHWQQNSCCTLRGGSRSSEQRLTCHMCDMVSSAPNSALFTRAVSRSGTTTQWILVFSMRAVSPQDGASCTTVGSPSTAAQSCVPQLWFALAHTPSYPHVIKHMLTPIRPKPSQFRRQCA